MYLFHQSPLPRKWQQLIINFAALHKEGAYTHLMNEKDVENLKWLEVFKYISIILTIFLFHYHNFFSLHNEPVNNIYNCVHSCSKYDLYSKSKVLVDVEKVKPYYMSLIEKVNLLFYFILSLLLLMYIYMWGSYFLWIWPLALQYFPAKLRWWWWTVWDQRFTKWCWNASLNNNKISSPQASSKDYRKLRRSWYYCCHKFQDMMDELSQRIEIQKLFYRCWKFRFV